MMYSPESIIKARFVAQSCALFLVFIFCGVVW